MEATTLGLNRTGAAMSPEATDEMVQAVDAFTPPGDIDTSEAETLRMEYITEADTVGSIPPPPTVKGVMKAGMAKMAGSHPSIFIDKIGERIAFERGGTRLYDALLTKYKALQASGDGLPPARDALASQSSEFHMAPLANESALDTLERIRAEEVQHFQLLVDALRQLGGDPTAQTPCADIVAVSSMGLVQVLNDPRTTMAQCLNAMLTAELTDNAGWELLATLAEDAGEEELTGKFLGALSQEQAHLVIIKSWLAYLVSQGAGTAAV
jgi:ferritin-like protein